MFNVVVGRPCFVFQLPAINHGNVMKLIGSGWLFSANQTK